MITERIALETCCGCGSCKSICPLDCIQMKQMEDGFLYPVVDQSQCVQCNKCVAACPVVNVDIPHQLLEEAYAACCQDKCVLEGSSSGGVFYVLAEEVISMGGVVFGAALTDDNVVRHILVQSIDALKELQGAKYTQSDTMQCFSEVRKELEESRWVLFTGTACQIAGLKVFLQRDYEQLITVDVICHGVLSPLILKKYILEVERKVKNSVIGIRFRDKTYGWHNYSLLLELEDGAKQIIRRNDSALYTIYGTDLGLRQSCYSCFFKDKNRTSDITLGDFWGIEKVMPEMDNPMGCSSVIIHSEKGKKLFKQILNKLVYKQVSAEDVKRFNPSYVMSTPKGDERAAFWKDVSEGIPIEKLARKYDKTDWKLKIKRKIKKYASKIGVHRI